MNETLLQDLIADAKRAGADAAEAVLAERAALSVGVRLGELEEVEREESRDIGLRVFVGRRQAAVSASDLSPDGLKRLVERCVAMARLAPDDPYAGLAPEDRLLKGEPKDLQMYDPAEPPAETLEGQARAIEDAARSVKGVTNSEGGSASWSFNRWVTATSSGFFAPHEVSSFSAYASVIAGDGDGMERAGEGRTVRWHTDMPNLEGLGKEAGRRAVSQLGARKLSSTTAAVIFENTEAGSLLSPLVGAISGPSVARGTSFLKDKLGQQLFASNIRITDDPHRLRGIGSQPFDDEGVANAPMDIIRNGILQTWLLNATVARQLKLETTGHAQRHLAGAPGVGPSNLTLEAGDKDLAGLMRDAGKGLFVTSMFGPSLNPNTGDWSVGVSGFWFEGGEIAYPVNEVTVAGNLLELYPRLVPGSDLELRYSTNAPSVLIDGMAIAGV
jgi:PmbA protein